MTDLSFAYRLELAGYELMAVQGEFPEFRLRCMAQALIQFAAGRYSFREAAVMLRRWR